MKKISFLIALLAFAVSCGQQQTKADKKLPKDEVMEEQEFDPEFVAIQKSPHADIMGFWVGDFIADEDYKGNDIDNISDGRNFLKKINLSIDSIKNQVVWGHTLVSGLQRSFKGTFELSNDLVYSFRVKEPGTNQYDGTFDFTIKDKNLTGYWMANKKLKISKRIYNLKQRKFEYNAQNMFEDNGSFVDEKDKKIETYTDDTDGEINQWTEELYAMSTGAIYEINASADRLTKEDVENLKKIDLMVIRNSIYARHGYSFSDPNLRSFFEYQKWFMPVNTDIKKDLTKIERDNIKLIMKYEKIATQNYDSYGR